MTSREKRFWKSQGIDWRKVEKDRVLGDLIEVTYQIEDGVPVMPDDPVDQAIMLCAAAIDQVLHGHMTGRVEVPMSLWDKCQKETVKWAVGRENVLP